MTKKTIYSLLGLTLTLFFLTECKPGNYIIDRGCVKDEFKITFDDYPEITFTPDKFFSTNALNLKTNYYGPTDFRADGYKEVGLVSYKVTIERFSNHKKYYGRMAFFGVPNKPAFTNKAVASFYKITIPENYFEEARDGITSTVYEYYMYNPAVKFPTWTIWFSDVPLK